MNPLGLVIGILNYGDRIYESNGIATLARPIISFDNYGEGCVGGYNL